MVARAKLPSAGWHRESRAASRDALALQGSEQLAEGVEVVELSAQVGASQPVEQKLGVDRSREEALELHLRAMRRDGDPIPESTTEVMYAEAP